MLNVEDGAHYCVRLSSNYVSGTILVPVVYWFDSQIHQVNCQLAFQEAGTTKPLERKRIDPAARGILDPATQFPEGR